MKKRFHLIVEPMLREIDEFVRTRKIEPEIRALYIAPYGERILVEPEGLEPSILNVVPWTAFALSFVYLAGLVRDGIVLQGSDR